MNIFKQEKLWSTVLKHPKRKMIASALSSEPSGCTFKYLSIVCDTRDVDSLLLHINSMIEKEAIHTIEKSGFVTYFITDAFKEYYQKTQLTINN